MALAVAGAVAVAVVVVVVVVSGFCDGGLNILFCRASQAAGSAFV